MTFGVPSKFIFKIWHPVPTVLNEGFGKILIIKALNKFGDTNSGGWENSAIVTWKLYCSSVNCLGNLHINSHNACTSFLSCLSSYLAAFVIGFLDDRHSDFGTMKSQSSFYFYFLDG